MPSSRRNQRGRTLETRDAPDSAFEASAMPLQQPESCPEYRHRPPTPEVFHRLSSVRPLNSRTANDQKNFPDR